MEGGRERERTEREDGREREMEGVRERERKRRTEREGGRERKMEGARGRWKEGDGGRGRERARLKPSNNAVKRQARVMVGLSSLCHQANGT